MVSDGVLMVDAGTVPSISGNAVSVYSATRDYNDFEQAYWDSMINSYPNNTMVYNSTPYYNCHSYAWYKHLNSNPYWIDNPSPCINDNVTISVSSPQLKDIVVYRDSAGRIAHSGVVYDTSDGMLICSKWGPSAVFMHALDDVPDSYLNNGVVDCEFYRYHNYVDGYAGSNYHAGNVHNYQYADVCTICNHKTNYYWIQLPCRGGMCAEPWSNDNDHELN